MNPTAALLILPIAWIMTVSGRRLNRLICPALGSDAVTTIERSVFGLATGAILLALGVLALGLLGLLAPLPVAVWCVILGLLGGMENLAVAREKIAAIKDLGSVGRAWPYSAAIALVGIAALGGCFIPPTSSEWDSLSYHLADPKIYVAAHRIFYLPWESHSNFAFNMEMLYSIGLLAHSMALSKLFHFTLGIAGAAGLYRLARRVLGVGEESSFAPFIALAIYVTIPLVFWEAGTAYVDLAATTYGILGLLALAIMVRTEERRFGLLAGLMLGGMFGIKATALVTIGLYAIGLVVYAKSKQKPFAPAVRTAVWMTSIALVLGSPWYIKSWIYTGNPFYPFGYSLFGGRYWSPVSSAAYTAAQYGFGVGHRPVDLLLIPWNLTMYLVPGHLPPAGFTRPFNDYQSTLSSLTPIFLFCAIAALAIPLKAPRSIKLLTVFSLILTVIWFYLTQQVRYLLPLVPILCLLSGWVLERLWIRSGPARAAAVLCGAAALVFNLALIGSTAAVQWSNLGMTGPALERYIGGGLNSYGAMEFLNTQTPPDAKVVCYGEPRTLYLNREHMWGDSGTDPVYPPYTQLGSPEALRAWFHAHGYHYILINSEFATLAPGKGWAGMVYALTEGGDTPPVFANGRGVYVFEV